MSVEGINTAVEKIADFIQITMKKLVSLKISQLVQYFFAAITAIVIGLIIYVPYISGI
jgi:diacylglycerol kinase (ATP)